ncbi:TMV resistance protein N-like [Cynara cardunculus var. scolymus]|uniref:TMV resistance protein N-like n=1 Tax=Cynara cardunculus var. scolymus TaxID=59895 RepID=UPI000D630678|nr:TMV resistance protein N-like [Cynara cardunculus var. scolymus]
MSQIVKRLQEALDYQVTASSGLWQNAALQQGLSTSKDNRITQSGFRGVDTRYGFVDHLYHALARQGIKTYRDDEMIVSHEHINPSKLKANEESRIAVIIFSNNYSKSSWCLEELALIMKCKDERGQIVMPIFYHVEPQYIRKQYQEFEEGRYMTNVKKIESWRKALVDACNIPGWFVNNSHE